MTANMDAFVEGLVQPDGTAKYTRTEVEDVMAVVFLNSFRKVAVTTKDSDALMASFFTRIGVHTNEDLENLGELVQVYFERVPLHEELMSLLVGSVQSERPQPQSLRAGYAISSAF